ncbi:MAG: AI-2E family transporter, partial [Armatimonadetes bacterium]|nr:AI-2E family transporter [Armatimonadota bacterium]
MAGSRVLLWVAIVLIATLFLYTVRSILLPFIIGIIVAALLDPAIRKLRLKGFSRAGAVWTVFLGFFLVVAIIGRMVAPAVSREVGEIQGTVTHFVNDTLFPPTNLEQFLSDTEVLSRLQPYPDDPKQFREWMTDETKEDKEYNVFFRSFSGDLIRHELPATRPLLIDALNSPEEGGLLDRTIARNKGFLEDWGLPTTREGFEAKFQIEKSVKALFDSALGGAGAIFQYLVSSIVLLVLTPIITLYFLFDYDNFKRRVVTWIPPAIRPAATDLMTDIGAVLSAYVRGLTTSIAIYAAIMAILLWLLGVPYSLFLGILFGVLYIIPYLGSWITMAVILLATLMKGDTTTHLFNLQLPTQTAYIIFCLAAYFIVDRIYDQFCHPRIVGKAVGLHPVMSFFVILSGAALFGLAGMILAFPIAGTIKVILDRLIRYTTAAHGAPLHCGPP